MRSSFSAGELVLPRWAERSVARLGPRAASRRWSGWGWGAVLAGCVLTAITDSPISLAAAVAIWLYLSHLSRRVRCPCGILVASKYGWPPIPRRCRGCGHDLTRPLGGLDQRG